MKNLPPVSPPVVTFLLGAALVGLAAAAIDVPAPGVVLLLAVAWSAARGGVPAGMVSTAFAVAAVIAISTLDRGAAFTPEMAVAVILSTLSFILITYLIGTLRHRLDDAHVMHASLEVQAAGAEERLARVLEGITDGFLTLDAHWHITQVNRRGEMMLGRDRDKLIGRYILEAFPESVGSVIHREMDRARREMKAADFEAFYTPGNRWFEVRGFPATDGGMTVYFRDVTKRKRAREALMLQARMLDAVRQAVIGVEPDGVIFYWNRVAEELLGWRSW